MNADNLKKEIKKIKIGHVALLCAGIFLAFTIIGSILLFAGGWGWSDIINFDGDLNIGPGQTYDVNDRQEFDLTGVDRIQISTVSDDATIVAGSGKVVAELTGRCRTAGKPIHLEARKQGGTLVIEVKYPVSSSSSSTRLTVTIPAEYSGDLSVTTTSGSARADALPFRLGKVSFHSVSGDINFTTVSFTQMEAGTTSGNITIGGITGKTRADSISGDVNLDYAEFAETTVHTVSGGVSAAIPRADGFALDFGSVSGDLTSSHPGLGVSRADRSFKGSAANGTVPFNVSTTSGDLRIEGK